MERIDRIEAKVQELGETTSRLSAKTEALEKRLNGLAPAGNPAPWMEAIVLNRALMERVDKMSEKLDSLEKKVINIQIKVLAVIIAISLLAAFARIIS